MKYRYAVQHNDFRGGIKPSRNTRYYKIQEDGTWAIWDEEIQAWDEQKREAKFNWAPEGRYEDFYNYEVTEEEMFLLLL